MNPLACYKNKLGTSGGRISKEPITYSDLIYNRRNFRDIYTQKPKGIKRKEWMEQIEPSPPAFVLHHKSEKAKRFLKSFNNSKAPSFKGT